MDIYNKMAKNLGLLYFILSIGLLGMGLFASIRDKEYFYSGITVVNLIAWYMVLIIEDD